MELRLRWWRAIEKEKRVAARRWRLGSAVLFTSRMLLSSIVAVGILVVILVVVARLDCAFFEVNGMMHLSDVREAFYYQIFQVDTVFWVMLGLGLLAVAVISMLFCVSQMNYFKRLAATLESFAEKCEMPSTNGLGRFNPHAAYFFDILSRRIKGEKEDSLEPALTNALKNWPKEPGISWADQLQFSVVSGLLGIFFSLTCVTFYYKVTERVVELANTLAHFSTARGPDFLAEQFSIVNVIVWCVLLISALSFIFTGFRLGRHIAEADYAILRDMRNFLTRNYDQRFFLRNGDAGSEYIHRMNVAVERIAERLKSKA